MAKNTEGEREEKPLEKDKGREKRRETKNKRKNKPEPLDPDEGKNIPEKTKTEKGITPDKVRVILDNLGQELPPEKLETLTKEGKKITVRFHPDLAEDNFPDLIAKLEAEREIKIIPKWDDEVDSEKGFEIVSEIAPEKPETSQKLAELPPPLVSPLRAGGEESLLKEIKSEPEETEPEQKAVGIEEVVLKKTAAKTETEETKETKEIPPRIQEVLDRLNAEPEKYNYEKEIGLVSPLGFIIEEIKKEKPQEKEATPEKKPKPEETKPEQKEEEKGEAREGKKKETEIPQNMEMLISLLDSKIAEFQTANPETKDIDIIFSEELVKKLGVKPGNEKQKAILQKIDSIKEKGFNVLYFGGEKIPMEEGVRIEEVVSKKAGAETKIEEKTETKEIPPRIQEVLDRLNAELEKHSDAEEINVVFNYKLANSPLGADIKKLRPQSHKKIQTINYYKERGLVSPLGFIIEEIKKEKPQEKEAKKEATPAEKSEMREESTQKETAPSPSTSPSGRGSATEKPQEPITATRKAEAKTEGPGALDGEKQKPGRVAREAETPIEIRPYPSRVSEGRLAEKRQEYLEAKRLRGKFIGRGEFKGKEGEAKLAQIGEEYSKMRAEYIRGKAAEVLKEQKLPPTELKTKVVEKLLEEYNREDGEREKLIEGREKGLGQRFKEWWRRHPKARMLVGYGLTGASVGSMLSGQLWLTPWLIGARAAFAGTGAALGTEGMLSRYSKTLGEKGLVNELAKFSKEEKAKLKKIKDKGEQEKTRQKMINDNIAKVSPEDLAREMARVKALQEKKGVKLENIGPYGAVLSALRAREQELLKKRITAAMEKGERSKENLLFEAINSGLEKEAREMDKNVEGAGEAERKKAIKRWVFAASAGAITAGLTAWWGFHRLGEISGKGKIAGGAAHAKTALGLPAPEGLATDFEVIAGKGDSVWKMAKRALAEKYGSRFTNLDEARRTYVIDAVKDKIAKNPARFGLTDIDRVKIGQKIDFGGLIKNNSIMEGIFGKAGRLTHEQAENILSNNETVREFHRLHPEIRLDSENIDSILAGKGKEVLGTEPATPQTDISAPEITPEETPSLEESAIPAETEATKIKAPQAEETQSPKAETPSPTPEAAPEQDISEAMIQEIPDWTPEKIAKTTLPLIQENKELKTVKGILEHYLTNLKNGEIFLPEQEQANTAIKEIAKRTKELGESAGERYEKTLLENTKIFIGTATLGRE